MRRRTLTKRTILLTAAMVTIGAMVLALVALATASAGALPWAGAYEGKRAVSGWSDSPLPPPRDQRAYLPCVLNRSEAGSPPASPTATVTATPTATNTPTATPSSTATGTSTATPTPTATATPLPVRVLLNHSHYVDGEGRLHVVGEVENTTADPVYRVGVQVEFLSAAGGVVATRGAYAPLQHLAAGGRTCFHISLPSPGPWATYRFEEPTYEPGPQPPQLNVVNHTGMYVPAAGWYLLGGEVRNDHGARVDRVFGIGTLYDAAGDVVGCDAALVLPIDLDPDQVGLLEIRFADRDFQDVTDYRVQADGGP